MDVLVRRKQSCFVCAGKVYYFNEVSGEVSWEHPQPLSPCNRVEADNMLPPPITDDFAALARDRRDMLPKQKEVKLLSRLKQTARMLVVNPALCGVWTGVQVQICMYEPQWSSKLLENVDCVCVG